MAQQPVGNGKIDGAGVDPDGADFYFRADNVERRKNLASDSNPELPGSRAWSGVDASSENSSVSSTPPEGTAPEGSNASTGDSTRQPTIRFRERASTSGGGDD